MEFGIELAVKDLGFKWHQGVQLVKLISLNNLGDKR